MDVVRIIMAKMEFVSNAQLDVKLVVVIIAQHA